MNLKNTLRKIYITALLAASAVTLAACGINRQQESSEAQTIIIGSDTYPPFTYLDSNGVPTGIDVDIATEAFKRLGYNPEFKLIDWERKNELLADGDIDCIWGCFSMSGREELYNWAGPYMVSKQMVAVNPGSDIYTLKDLEGKIVAVQSTTKPDEIFTAGTDARIPKIGNIVSTEERAVQYAALGCGYVDAIAAHQTAILQYMKDYNIEFRFIEEPLLVTGIGVAFDRSDSRGINSELNEEFVRMHEDGSMAEIIGRYLDDPESYLEVDSID